MNANHSSQTKAASLRALVVDDSEDDVLLIVETLRRGGYDVHYSIVQSAQGLEDELTAKPWDIVLCDYSMPVFDAPSALRLVKGQRPDMPLIIISGTVSEDIAVESLKQGADDYLSKQNLKRLTPAVKRCLHEAENRRRRRVVEAALSASETRYRNLVETMFDWLWETDEDGCYVFASSKSRSLLGYEPEELLGNTPFDLMSRNEAQRMRPILHGLADKHAPYSQLEHVMLHKDGHEVVLQSSAVPLFGPNREFKGYQGVGRDITEGHRLQEQVRQAQKMEAVGRITGGVAHDFNNILTASLMHLGLIESNPNLDPDTRAALKDLESQQKRAANLTRQLLLFSRRSAMQVCRADLNEIIHNFLKLLQRTIGEQIAMSFVEASSLPLVEADVGMIEQVIMNLVINARDAMPRGGKLEIATKLVTFLPSDVLSNPGRRNGSFVCLQVTDTGCGMDDHTLRRIFEPFFTTKPPGQGTGLGLSTVYGIVTQHKGWVEVDSKPNCGTTFRVLLPVFDSTANTTTCI